MESQIKHICCMGAGYVGGPTCAVIAAMNPHVRVTVVDPSQSRISAWNSKNLPFYEPGLHDIVSLTRDGNSERLPNLFFSSDVEAAIRDAQLIFIAVNTPTKTVGLGAGRACDLSSVEAAARQIAAVSTSNKIVVEKSTVPCGTAQRLRNIFAELGRPSTEFEVLSNPEFMAEGTAVKDLLQPNRILIGSLRTDTGMAAASILTNVFASWVPRERIVNVNVVSSEMAKLAANCLLAQRISSINSLSALCESEGAVIDEIARAVGLDDRIGPSFLKASVGFGGSCFKKDVLSLVYMAESQHLTEVAAYWRAVIDINEYQKRRFAEKIVSTLNNTLADKEIAILGYAYKKNTGDTRESAAITVVEQLIAENARVRIFDPKVAEKQIRADLKMDRGNEGPDHRLKVCKDAYEACRGAAAIVILTEWDAFKTDSVVLPTIIHGSDRNEIAASDEYTNDAYEALGLPSPAESTDEESNMEPQQKVTTKHSSWDKSCDRLDWMRISRIVQRPRIVFDGRNIVNPYKLRALGFCVHNIGNAQSSLQLL